MAEAEAEIEVETEGTPRRALPGRPCRRPVHPGPGSSRSSPGAGAAQVPGRGQGRRSATGPRTERAQPGDSAKPGDPARSDDREPEAPTESASDAHSRTAPSAVVPYAAARRAASRSEVGFDYFGTHKKQPRKHGQSARRPEAVTDATAAETAAEAMPEEDLADVIGAEALAEQKTAGEVIDLTAHDETEQFDVAELRSAIS
ncbi:hypothetical protein NKH77_29615 [Streptomyces sp. M19]